jgi:anaerobic selenocysteine-containing dehydrogenase
MTTIGDDLLEPGSAAVGPKIEAVIVYNANPLAIAPDSDKVMRGFQRDDLFTVVLEHFQTDSADYADILLPATTQLEHVDAHRLRPPVHDGQQRRHRAAGRSLPNTEIFRLLARAWASPTLRFGESDDQLAAKAFDVRDARAVHFDWESLKQRGWQKLTSPPAPLRRRRLPTPSGKCASSIRPACWPTASIRCRPGRRITNRSPAARNWRAGIRWR